MPLDQKAPPQPPAAPADYYRRYTEKRLGISAEVRRAFYYRSMARLIRRAQPSPRVIVDVGCGVGFLSKRLASLPGAPLIVGADRAAEALVVARDTVRGCGNVRLCRGDAQALPLSSNSADVVAAFDVIEHLAEPELFLAEAHRVLRPGGVLILSTPNPQSLGARLKGHHPEWNGRPWAERGREWFGWRDETHCNIRPIVAWRRALADEGFHVIRDGTDFWWDAPYVRVVPTLLQRVVLGAGHRLVTGLAGFLPWRWGENYLAICRRQANGTRPNSDRDGAHGT